MEAAAELGVTKQAISDPERGLYAPDERRLEKLVTMYATTVQALRYGTGAVSDKATYDAGVKEGRRQERESAYKQSARDAIAWFRTTLDELEEMDDTAFIDQLEMARRYVVGVGTSEERDNSNAASRPTRALRRPRDRGDSGEQSA